MTRIDTRCSDASLKGVRVDCQFETAIAPVDLVETISKPGFDRLLLAATRHSRVLR